MHKPALINYFNNQARVRDRWRRRNWYYHKTVAELCRFMVPEGSKVLEVGCGAGELLAALKPRYGLGVDISPAMVELARSKHPQLHWEVEDAENLLVEGRFDYVIMSDLIGFLDDVEQAFASVRKVSQERTRLVITYYNYLWEPVLKLAEFLHLKARQPLQNWLAGHDIKNLLHLAGFEAVREGKKMLLPVWIPLLSAFFNKFVASLPLFSKLGLVQYCVARPVVMDAVKDYSVSVVIPARNERGNIEDAVRRLPRLGAEQEIIFVEGDSSDGTLEEIKRVADKYKEKKIRYAVQTGHGKGDAVRLGFQLAAGEVLMILDADLTVAPEDLIKFYRAIASGRGEFINGSRLVYPLENESMRLLNVLGNKFFSIMFSWVLGQRIKDTLCGTKVLFKKDYEMIAKERGYFGDFDPFGDFDLLFGAAKLNLKIVEMPVRYYARIYGRTNIQRWRHGRQLLKMTFFAARKLKFN